MDDWLVGQFINPIIGWFAETILGALTALWDLLAATVFVSPDVTLLPQVTAFADTSLAIVNTCYVLAFLWVAILVMGRDTIQSRVGPGELIPRLVIGLIAANFAIPICSTAIQLANAFTAALTGQDITAPGSLRQLRAITVAALSGQAGTSPVGFLLILIGLLITVLLGMLVVQWIMRLGLLVVTVGIAPIAVALHGTAQTEGAAKLWWRTLLGCLGTVTLQAVALHTTLTIFLAPDANLPLLGLPGDPGAVMNLLIVVCLLWGVVKIPALMRRYVTQGRPNAMGTILRVVLVQQLTRGLPRALGSRGGPGRAVGGSGGRGGGAGAATRGWPVTSGGGGGGRPRPAAWSPAPRLGMSAPRPLPRPSGAGPGRTGIAYPTGRPVRPYSRDDIAGGVDLSTRAMKARAVSPSRKAPR
ncbi:conjugal transfer protein TrbL family protein [Micromonospora sp. CPCC 205539]|uniref:conjugal transfer protein TrbL family protein n=1 Tax=Micromonospora sp. CPCC 205539 TaxID=3122408 RepID=UPI002FF185E2